MQQDEFIGVLPREIAILLQKYELGLVVCELLEITNGGMHDCMSATAWDAAKLLKEQIGDPESLRRAIVEYEVADRKQRRDAGLDD